MEPNFNPENVKHFAIANATLPVVVQDERDPNVLSFPKGWTIADSKPMRDGTVQDVKSMNIAKYKSNPVVLIDHNWSVDGIIGQCLDLKKEEDGTKLVCYSIRFASHPEAQKVMQLVLDRMVRDTSTGLLVGKYEEEEGHTVYKDSELVEFSIVMVGNNYASRLNQLTQSDVEPTETPTVEETPVAPATEETSTEETPTPPAQPAEDQQTAEEVNALKARVAELESNTPVREPKKSNTPPVEPKLSSAQILHGQLSAFKRGDNAKLSELNEIARESHRARVAGLDENGVRNALDFGDTALVPSAELLAEVRKPDTAYGKLVAHVNLKESLIRQSVTYTVSPGFVDFVDDASFCADAGTVDPTYTLKTLTLVRKSAATAICRDLDTVSPIALEQDVATQLRNGALKEHDEVIISALLAIGSPVTQTIDETSATTLFTGLGEMPGKIPATYRGDGADMAYITTWGNFQYLKSQANLLSNASLAMELAQGMLNGFPVHVIPNGLLPSYAGTTTADDNWIIFGALKGVTVGRWENILEIDLRKDGTVAGVNLTASDSIAVIGRMHIGATADFENFVFAR